MYHKDSSIIKDTTFTLIQQLQEKEYLQDFVLVGGTGLALQIGHRFSIDIDLFTPNEFICKELYEQIEQDFTIKISSMGVKNTLLAIINEVKTDFIKHPYTYINPPIKKEGITFLSCEDIAAMKVNAIINSGQRWKDFIDIYFLLEIFSMEDIVHYFNKKYPNFSTTLALKAISYFDDIDFARDEPILKFPLKEKEVKNRILKAVNNRKKIFN